MPVPDLYFVMKKMLVIQVAALSHEIARGLEMDLTFHAGKSVFPAVTCTVQATLRTAALPSAHGMVANGRYHRELRKAMFWEQSSAWVGGSRIWHDFRRAGGRVAMLFWQQSMGETVDLLLTPAPIHRHGGGMIQDCYGLPDTLYPDLCRRLGRSFRLQRYWGPTASARVGDWIAEATSAVISDDERSPHLCLTYLPSLDYDFQRFGPSHDRARRAVAHLRKQLELLLAAAARNGYEVTVFGDYAIAPCTGAAVFPNRILCEHGLMKTRDVRGRLYADLHTSRAFAMVDHEVAHIHVADEIDLDAVHRLLEQADGIEDVFVPAARDWAGINHDNAGELIAITQPGRWFAYPWWTHHRNAPDYAGHVDIHNKPGFDPCELFFSLYPPGISRDTRRIRGTHGRIDRGREIATASTVASLAAPGGLLELAQGLKHWLETG